MKRSNLLDLMQRYVTGQVTAEEKRKIEAWLDLKKTDEGADLVLGPDDEEKLFRAITNNIDSVEEVRNFRPRRNVRALLSAHWVRVAASVAVLAVVGLGAWFLMTRSTPVQERISAAGSDKTILDDGSIVWFQEASQLTYVNRDDTRQATFQGDALFEVARDPEKPFVISCGDVKVEVVGTSFNLKSAADLFELRVLRGKVRVSTTLYPDGIVVQANEMAVYRASDGITKNSLAKDEAANAVADTDYDMAFDNTSMKIVLSKLASKFDVEIVVENPAVKKCRITADLTDNSLQSSMEILAELLDIGFTISDKKVEITGNGCN